MKVDIKSFHPEVKASKSVKRLQRYSHFKPRQFNLKFNGFMDTLTPFIFIAQPPVDAHIAACYGFYGQHWLVNILIGNTWKVLKQGMIQFMSKTVQGNTSDPSRDYKGLHQGVRLPFPQLFSWYQTQLILSERSAFYKVIC